MSRARCAAVAVALMLGSRGADAYVQQRATASPFQPQKWTVFPITYAVNIGGSTDILTDAEFSEIDAAFAAWQGVSNTALQFSAQSPTPDSGILRDGHSTISWVENPDVNPDIVPDVAASAMRFVNLGDASQIVEADIILNGAYFSWTATGATGVYDSQTGPVDVRAVMTHEIGHLLGLLHVTSQTSTLYVSQYPGSVRERTLSADEIAAIQAIYPSGGAPADTTISGSITRGGIGVPGAYVVAYQNDAPVVGAITDQSGNYILRRLAPGSYQIRVQPYSIALGNGGYFSDPTHVDTNFLAVFFKMGTATGTAEQATATPEAISAGQAITGINITVSATGNQDDPFEADDTFSTAHVINVVGNAEIHHTYPAGDPDWVSFTAVVGNVYVIETRNLGFQVSTTAQNSDTALALYDTNGTTRLDGTADFNEKDDRNTHQRDFSSRIVYYATTGGVRYVKVTQFSPTAAGAGVSCDLRVTQFAAPAAPTITSVVPAQATTAGGIVVAVHGTGIGAGAQVSFGVVGVDDATDESAEDCDVSGTTCQTVKVTVPSHAMGVVNVNVKNPGGATGSLGNGFTFVNQQVGTFVDGTSAAFTGFIGHGPVICWGDYDGDSDPDLFTPYLKGSPPSATGMLWQNNGNGTFTDVTAAALLDTSGMALIFSCAWGDYDKDGDLDLYLVYTGGGSSNRLYRNNGDGTFTNVAGTALVTGNTSFSKVDAAWADYDQDGKLDLYLAYTGGTDQLFHNNGGVNPTFTDLAPPAGVATAGQSGRVLWADYDNDGKPDLFRVQRSGQPDILYHNNGNGTFSNVTTPAGIVEGPNCFDEAWADFNNDGFLDLLCVGESFPMSLSQRFWINQGNGSFVDRAAASGINNLGRHATALAVLDKDNDGGIDAYIGCSTSGSSSDGLLDVLLQNNGGNPVTFTNVARLSAGSPPPASGVDETVFPRNANAVACADINNDGNTDILVTGSGSSSNDDAFFWRNTSNTNAWITVRLRGTTSNTFGIGAVVTVIPNLGVGSPVTEEQCLSPGVGVARYRQEAIGGSLNQNMLELHFGLGDLAIGNRRVDCVNVTWPRSGLIRGYPSIATNQVFVIEESIPLLHLTKISPSFGSTIGGQMVTLTGFNISNDVTQVFFDSVAATGVVRVDGNTMTCVTPPGAAGPADVRIQNPAGTAANTLVGGYTYIGPGTTINLTMNKDSVSNGVKLTWTDIGQGRYRVRRATGPTTTDFNAGLQTIVSGTQFVDAGVLGVPQIYYYKVDEGGI